MDKFSGIVIKGDGRARKLGFPTANLNFQGNQESGVYAGMAKYLNKKYSAIIFLGRNKKILEAHLLDFSGDLYGKDITIEIGEKIREVMDFKNDEELINQIEKDIKNLKARS